MKCKIALFEWTTPGMEGFKRVDFVDRKQDGLVIVSKPIEVEFERLPKEVIKHNILKQYDKYMDTIDV